MASKYTIIVDPLSTGQEYPAAFREAGADAGRSTERVEPPPATLPVGTRRTSSTCTTSPATSRHWPRSCGRTSRSTWSRGPRAGSSSCDQLIEILVPGTGNVPELASARRDKWDMAAGACRGRRSAAAADLTADPAEAERWLKENDLLGRRLVIKPPKSAAGDEVYIVFEDGDWRERFDRVLGRTNKMGLTTTPS